MRKKSHVLVARFVADSITQQELKRHRKAFCFGSILPDLKPSFLTTKHEFYGTFAEIQDKLKALSDVNQIGSYNPRVYFRRLGEVIHYIADYFTFPHNHTYPGNLAQHCKYENELKKDLKTYIKSGQAYRHTQARVEFQSNEEVITYIRNAHKQYLNQARNVKEDIYFILNICFQVVQYVSQIFTEALQLHNYKFNLVA